MHEAWSNYACLGYIVGALERLHYPPEEIEKVVEDLKQEGFDCTDTTEAAEHYINGPY